mmetsp:Transcript_12154/g.17525  ORF Transcript_12154/g.17525 Transcript_12154/m.17525 type:complete len:280 (+) Transcript_12154:131-970(+)
MSAYALNLFPETACISPHISSHGAANPSKSPTQPSMRNLLNVTISDASVDPQFLLNCFATKVKSHLTIPPAMDATSMICSKVIFFITVKRQGSTYVAKRTLSQFQEFRSNLLKEWNYDINLPELPLTPWDDCSFDNGISNKRKLSQQTWRRVEHSGLGSFASMICQQSIGSGFTKLRNLFHRYIPFLDNWLTGVCEVSPMSNALYDFLWEPSTKHDTTTTAIRCLLEPITEGGEEDIWDEDSIRSLHTHSRSRTCSSEIIDEDGGLLLSDPCGSNLLRF